MNSPITQLVAQGDGAARALRRLDAVPIPFPSLVTDIDRNDLETCLAVLARVEQLPVEHPQAVAVRRATAKIFKTVKERRRAERRAAVAAADRSVLAATATAAPGRIDDETRGIELTSAAGRERRHADPRAAVLPVQAQVHRGRRLLPPALPGLRGAQPGAP